MDLETLIATDPEDETTTITKLSAGQKDRQLMMYKVQAMTDAKACSYLAAIPL